MCIWTWKKLLARSNELVIDYENRIAYIFTKSKNVELPFDLAIDISNSYYFRLDSGNEHFNTRSFVIDYENIREDGIRGQQPEKQIHALFDRYDSSQRIITFMDF